MIFSQLVAYFGRAGRQDADGNLTGLHFFIDAPGLLGARGRSFATLLRRVNALVNTIHTSRC